VKPDSKWSGTALVSAGAAASGKVAGDCPAALDLPLHSIVTGTRQFMRGPRLFCLVRISFGRPSTRGIPILSVRYQDETRGGFSLLFLKIITFLRFYWAETMLEARFSVVNGTERQGETVPGDIEGQVTRSKTGQYATPRRTQSKPLIRESKRSVAKPKEFVD